MLGLTNKTIAITGGVLGTTAIGGGVATVYLTSNNNKGIKAEPDKQTQVDKGSVPVTPAKIKSITDLLKKNNRELLGNQETWTNNWAAFKKKYTTEKIRGSVWAFEGWESKLAGDEITENFKNKCSENSQSNVIAETDELYEEVRDFCTKEKTNGE